MQEQILQSPWQKAKHLKPQLSSEVEVFRRHFRGEQWYVLRRSGSDRLYRVNPEAWQIIGLCNGGNSLEDILSLLRRQGTDLSESDLLAVIYQLTHQGLINNGLNNTPAPVSDRHAKAWYSSLKNPLAIRLPIWDPDYFLTKYLDKVRFLFSWQVLAIWVCVVSVALLTAIAHWGEITHDVIDRVFSPKSLVLLWFIYPVTKFIHEMAHGFSIKVRGGEVHEIGITLMYGVPLPYVDASDALTFSDKRHRLLVDGIGIMAELFIASMALFIWLNISSGLASQFAYNTMIICSVSTLFFNGNPLMRYDGYYLLADWLEIPNLGTRSIQYWRYLFNRYALGLEKTFSVSPREQKWLALHMPLAMVYRATVITTIVLVAAQHYLPLGIALGVWFFVRYLITPLNRAVHYLLSPSLGEQKARGLKIVILIPTVILLLLIIPFPLQRTMPAVVWLPDQAQIRAATDGLITDVLPESGAEVSAGAPLFRLNDPYLTMKRAIAEAQYNEVSAKLTAARAKDPVEAQQLQEDLKASRAELEELQKRLQQLQVDSPSAGYFYLPPDKSERGRFVKQGDLLGYVLDRDKIILKVLVGQNDIAMISSRSNSLRVKLSNWPGQTFDGKIVRVNPSASNSLPSAILGTLYGGPISVDPGDTRGIQALEEWFQLEVEVQGLPTNGGDRGGQLLWAGSRAWVRFDLGYESIATQLYWVLSQLFMKKLML